MRTALLLTLLAASLPALGQWKQQPETGSQPEKLNDRTVLQGQVATSTSFGVHLVEPAKFAAQHQAMVEAALYGLQLVDPNPHQAPNEHQGHIVYRVDNGPEQTAVTQRFTIGGLAPGRHTIVVHLADNQGHAISPETRLPVEIPR